MILMHTRRPWREELAIIDKTMRAISGVTDPEELVSIYFEGIGELLPVEDYLSVSRRGVQPPMYLITRSSRFTESFNPWTERHKLPLLSGGLLQEIAYADEPVIIEDLDSRLQPDDPAYFYLQGFRTLVAMPQYDGGAGLNVTLALFPPDVKVDHAWIPMMHWQGGLFGRGTQNLVLRNQLSDALSTLDRELQVVGNIQRSLLPRDLPKIKGFELATFYRTSARAGGDYYDFFPLEDGGWGLFIADVSGHGTPAAVLMAITHAIAHAQPRSHPTPAELLTVLNERLARSYTSGGTFVTAFYAVLNPHTRTLTYATAGHNPPRLVRGNQVLSLNKAVEIPLGILHHQHYQQAVQKLEPGDLLLLYTDGITEASPPLVPGEARELFGLERLDKLLLECGDVPVQGCLDRICEEVTAFCKDAPPIDDQTLIGIQCK
jgi:sigma-B regulation protein RsbU (phosphoserine phosphatase)